MTSAEKVSTIEKWRSLIAGGISFTGGLIACLSQSEFRPKLAKEGSIIFMLLWIAVLVVIKILQKRPLLKKKFVFPVKEAEVHLFIISAIVGLWLPYFIKPLQAQKVEIILDVSQRMGAQFDAPGTTKFSAARAGVLQVLDYLEGQNVEVALRLVHSREVGQCVIEPRSSLAVDFTRDLDKIRDQLKKIHVNPVDKAPVVDAIDLSIDHYENAKRLDKGFFIYSFLGGDDTCGGKIGVYLDSPKVKKNSVDADLFLIILLGTDEEASLRNLPNARLDYASSAVQVKNIISSNNQLITSPTPIVNFKPLSADSKENPTPISTTLVAAVQDQIIEPVQSPDVSDLMPSAIETPAIEIPNTGVGETPLPTPTKDYTASSTPTPTKQPTNTSTKTPTNTPTKMPTNTPTKTPINTPTKTPINTPTKTPTNIPTDMPTATPIVTQTDTPTATPTLGAATWVALPPQPDVFLPGCPLINDARVYAQISYAQASISATLVPDERTNNVFRLDFYNAGGVGGDYAGWEVWLGPDDNSGIDLSPYSSLAFYIRGNVGGEETNFYLMMPVIGEKYQRFWKGVGWVTPITTSWQHVVIPLSDFTLGQKPEEQIDLTNIQKIQILFEWYPQPTSGRIFVDDLCVQ